MLAPRHEYNNINKEAKLVLRPVDSQRRPAVAQRPRTRMENNETDASPLPRVVRLKPGSIDLSVLSLHSPGKVTGVRLVPR